MDKQKIVVLNKENEEIDLYAVIKTTIDKIAEKDAISNSKGRVVISKFLDSLMENDDPFLRALVVLGDEKAINTIGVLLFVAFQLGVNFGSEMYVFPPEETK